MILALLTRILIWAAIGLLIWYFLQTLIPKSFLTWFGGAIILALIVLSFAAPNDNTIGVIWNIISQPLTPLGFSILLLGISLVSGLRKVKGHYVAIALTILLLSSVPFLARALVNQAEESVQTAYRDQRAICQDICPVEVPEAAPLSRVVAMVVLGENMDMVLPLEGLPSRPDRDTPLSGDLVGRLNSASDLYGQIRRSGAVPYVVVTAGPVRGSAEEQANNDQLIRNWLARGGVVDNITILKTGMDVHGTARELKRFLGERGIDVVRDTPQLDADRVALVAPALIMRRAALTLENEGFHVVAWPTDIYGESRPTGDTLAKLSDFVPSVEALRLTTRYWQEFLTSVYYFLRNWLPGFNVSWEKVVEVIPQ
jgi:uncharacterized SAM-binding protein YcdF (DUF218 family)